MSVVSGMAKTQSTIFSDHKIFESENKSATELDVDNMAQKKEADKALVSAEEYMIKDEVSPLSPEKKEMGLIIETEQLSIEQNDSIPKRALGQEPQLNKSLQEKTSYDLKQFTTLESLLIGPNTRPTISRGILGCFAIY